MAAFLRYNPASLQNSCGLLLTSLLSGKNTQKEEMKCLFFLFTEINYTQIYIKNEATCSTAQRDIFIIFSFFLNKKGAI